MSVRTALVVCTGPLLAAALLACLACNQVLPPAEPTDNVDGGETPPAGDTLVAGAWELSDRVAGAQLSSHNRRWSTSWLLVDSMRYAEPRDDLGGIIVSSARGGRMVLRYNGDRPSYEDWGQDQRVPETQGGVQLISERPGRMLFDMPAETQLFLRTSEPVENFQLIPEEYESNHHELIWYPELVEKVSLGAVLRAIQLQQVNYYYQDSPTFELRFEDRTLPTDKLQSVQHGFAVELLIDLARRANVDFWYCIPDRASDDFSRSMAAVIEAELADGQRVFLEVGNEVWNAISPYAAQAEWMQHEADRRGLFQDLDAYARAQMMHALRTVEIGAIFEEVLGEDRVVVVLAQQVGNDYFHDLAAERLGDRAGEVEALAIAPYFGVTDAALLGTATDEAIFASIDASLAETLGDVARSAASAQRHGWPLIAYEGGQHIVPPNGWDSTDEEREQLQRINESAEMGRRYDRLLAGWSDAGGGLFMHYGLIYQQDGIWGAWGLFDRTDQGPTEKSTAFFRWAEFPR